MCYLFPQKVCEGKWKTAYNKLYRHQYHSMFSSKEGVGAKCLVLIAAWEFMYLCFLLLYLQDTCGNEKLPAAILTSSTLHLRAKINILQDWIFCNFFSYMWSHYVIYASELQTRLQWTSGLAFTEFGISERHPVPFDFYLHKENFPDFQITSSSVINCMSAHTSFSFHGKISIYKDTLSVIRFYSSRGSSAPLKLPAN